MTQHEVSAAMGRSPNFMTKCESGDRSIDVMELLELATIYKKPVSHFLR
uniref:XRE family transcriptional regulator n=2 Tax=Paracidobacterium acidisoli TaxID=2303751 RepID=A0A372IP80_9BACT